MLTDKHEFNPNNLASIVLIFVFVLGSVNAQTLPNGWQLETVHGPSQVGIVETIAVDINQDGLIDVVSASIDDGHVRAYINQDNLQFEQSILSQDVLGAYRLTATDLNGDGNTDFLVSSIERNEVIALIADNQAQPYGYRHQVIAGNTRIPTDAQAGDFNGDGLMDVVSISFEDNQLLLHVQNNQGDFSTQVIASSVQQPRKLVVADFNQDQWPDIMLASSGDDSVRLFANAGNMIFREILISDQLTGIRFIALCAKASDMYPNFVAAVTDADQVMLFTNNGQDSFTGTVIDDDLPAADGVSCANLDQDADLELISISRLYDRIYMQEISGPQNKQVIAGSRDGYISATAANLEHNGLPVILTQSFFENRNLFYSLDSQPQEQVIWEDFPDGALYVEAGDIDGDGDQDLVYAAFRGDKVYWAEQTADGYSRHVIYDAVDGPQSVTVFDIDEDGDMDVLTAGAWDDRFYFHQNRGQGEFKTYVISDQANNPARIAVMDVNGDSKLDVLTTSSLDDSLRWFDVNGVIFTEHLIDDQLDGALALSVEDVNDDGLNDIIVGSYFGDSVTAFYNNGLGQFNRQDLSTDKVKPTIIATADIDNDGDTDILFNASNDKNVWLLKNTDNQFQESLVYQGEDIIKGMALTDVNMDGYLDILSASDQTGSVQLSQNVPGSGFDTTLLTELRFGVSAIIPFSQDPSGRPRLALASNKNNSIMILSNSDLIFESGFE